jgi:pimeloyl-ACP methyl ester carboxylesterase
MTGAFVDLRGVRTWYGEGGGGPPLVMLHPGGVDSRAFAPNVGALAEHFHVWLPERRGHGRTPDTDSAYSYDLGADDTIQFLEQVVGGPARLFGMSDGSIVALHVARKRPELVERLVFAGCVLRVIIKLSSRINRNRGFRLMCSTWGQRIVRRTEVRVCRIESVRNVNGPAACLKQPVRRRG